LEKLDPTGYASKSKKYFSKKEKTKMSENKTVVLTARIGEEDKKEILDFAKGIGTQQQGFAEIAKRIKAGPERVEVEVEKNIEQVFPFGLYGAFREATDTHPSETIIRALEYANAAKEQENDPKEDPVNLPGINLEFPAEMMEQATKLRRLLHKQGKIPESTEKEFLEKLFFELFERYIDNKHEYLK
jgi:hypothetical protein